MLASAERAVRDLGAGKRLVIVDGVGYAAVGSICGVSNADIAGTGAYTCIATPTACETGS